MSSYSDDELLKLHNVEVEILDEIVRICNKYNLHYFLVGGTLLGAIRHKGFIPWDDDLDIAMPRSDYDRFISICEKELKSSYYLHHITTDKKYWLPFLKIRKEGTVFNEKNICNLNVKKGIYVDVFPLDTTDNNVKVIKSFKTRFIKVLNLILLFKIGYRNYKHKFFMFVLGLLFKPFTSKCIYKWQERLMKRDNSKPQKYFANYGSNYTIAKQVNPISYFEPAKKLEFCGKDYCVPNEYEKVISKLLGNDFMQLPPLEKRITHKPIEIRFGDENEKV